MREGYACSECFSVAQGFSAEELGIDTTNGHPGQDWVMFAEDISDFTFDECDFCNWDSDVTKVTYDSFENWFSN